MLDFVVILCKCVACVYHRLYRCVFDCVYFYLDFLVEKQNVVATSESLVGTEVGVHQRQPGCVDFFALQQPSAVVLKPVSPCNIFLFTRLRHCVCAGGFRSNKHHKLLTRSSSIESTCDRGGEVKPAEP